jgi:hypothetical protein
MLLVEQPLPRPSTSKEEPVIEVTIGAVAAHIGTLLCQSLLDYRAEGEPSAENRARGAEALALLHLLRRDNPLVDFEAAIRSHGKKALYEHLAHLPRLPDGTDDWIEYLLASVLDLLTRVNARRVH